MTSPHETAELAIAAILRDLELETSCYVERLCIEQLDISSVRDSRQQLIRRVQIDLRPQPGTRWRVEQGAG